MRLVVFLSSCDNGECDTGKVIASVRDDSFSRGTLLSPALESETLSSSMIGFGRVPNVSEIAAICQCRYQKTLKNAKNDILSSLVLDGRK